MVCIYNKRTIKWNIASRNQLKKAVPKIDTAFTIIVFIDKKLVFV